MVNPFRGRTRLVPTWNGAGLALLLFGTWYSAASQANGAAYLFLFVLMGVGLVSSVHTWMNLRDWSVTLEQPEPAFAGQEVACPVEGVNTSRRSRYALQLMFSRSNSAFFHELGPGKAARTELRFVAPRRGRHKINRLRAFTSYPLGFFKGSRWIGVDQTYLVYPSPSGNEPLPLSPQSGTVTHDGITREGDDFAGARAYKSANRSGISTGKRSRAGSRSSSNSSRAIWMRMSSSTGMRCPVSAGRRAFRSSPCGSSRPNAPSAFMG